MAMTFVVRRLEAEYRSESVRSNYEAGALRVNMYNQNREPMLAGFAEKYFETRQRPRPDLQIGPRSGCCNSIAYTTNPLESKCLMS